MNQRTLITVLTLSIAGVMTGCSDDDPADTNDATSVTDPQIDSSTIDNAVNDFLASNDVAGMSIATVKITDNNTLIWSNQYGFRNSGSQTPVNAETSFWLGSVSKSVMGVALMIANEKGFLQLDDDVHGLLSNQGTFSLDNPGQRPVSIAQLASHTSGIMDEPDDEDGFYDCAYFVPDGDGGHQKLINIYEPGACPEQSPVSLAGFLGAFLDAEGEFYSAENNFTQSTPGENFEYSNIGAGLAGYIVELTTGQDLAAYADQEIFTPLAMPNTSWRSDDLQPENIATPYVVFDDGIAALPVYELATWPDGGLRSNAADIAQLLGVVMNKGKHQATGLQLLSETSVSRMLPAQGEDYGLFWGIEEDLFIDGELRDVTGHSGSDPGAFSYMVFDPLSDVGVVIVGNGDDSEIDNDDGSPLEILLEALFEGAAAMN